MFMISDEFFISWINLNSELFKICELLSLGTSAVSKIAQEISKGAIIKHCKCASDKSDQKVQDFMGLGQECFSCFKCYSVAGPIVVHNARAKPQ